MRARARRYLAGLLGRAERKNGWQLAEETGERHPRGVQRLLDAARWDADAVRDDLRAYVVEHLGDPRAVLVVDETGFLKKGTKSVGVERQYSGTAGRRENCQVGVFLVYATARGRAFLDRALYLPKAGPTTRRGGGGRVPPEVRFATKPELARAMLQRAFTVGVPAAWVVGDTVYGTGRGIRPWLEAKRRAYVLAVPFKHRVWVGRRQATARAAVARLPPEAWARRSAGEGSRGPRWYDWAWLPLAGAEAPGWGHWLLARRSLADPADIAYSRVFAPATTPLEEAVRAAGAVGRGGGVRASEGRGGTGPVRGAPLGRLAPPRHPGPAGPRLPGGHPPRRRPARGQKGGARPPPSSP